MQEHPDFQNKNIVGYIALVREVFRLDAKNFNINIKHKQAQFLFLCQNPDSLKQMIYVIDNALNSENDKTNKNTAADKLVIEKKFHLSDPGNTEIMTMDQLRQLISDKTISLPQVTTKISLTGHMNRINKKLFQKLNLQIFPPRFKRYTKSEPPVSKTILTR